MSTDKKTLCYFSIDLSNPFGETLLKSVYHRTLRHNLELFVVHGGMINSPNEWESQRNILYRWIAQKKIDALLISSIFSFVNKSAIPEFLKPFKAVPTITLGEKIEGTPAIMVNNGKGFYDLVTHLVTQCGSRSFALITGPVNNSDSNERFDIVKSVLDKHQIPLDPNNIVCGTFGSASAISAIHELVDLRKASFDTLICFNDFMAIAAMEDLKRRGFRIPEDIKITGFDNTYESIFMNPPLTTVEYPIYELGELGVDYINKMLSGETVPDVTTLMTQFAPRLSSGNISTINPSKIIGTTAVLPDVSLANVADIFFEHHFETFCQSLFNGSRIYLPDDRKNWFVTQSTGLLKKLFSLQGLDVEWFISELEQSIFVNHNNEWSTDLWESAFSRLPQILDKISPEAAVRLKGVLASSKYFSHMYKNRYVINRLYLQSTEERYLLEMGEDLSTSFSLNMLAGNLALYCSYIGIRDCFVVSYTDQTMHSAQLLACIENGTQKDTSAYEEFSPYSILPSKLIDKYPSLVMESLYVRNENIGYVLFNLGDHPGLLYKSLRHQISSSIKGAQLVSTINKYSEGLEIMVHERTRKLNELNRDLK
ncbi:MAG TPA: substrate-binding domain-containing protein, partial [Spirochaetota bacterium]